MAVLVIAEHDNKTIKPATLNAVTAAGQLGSDVSVMVIGSGCARRPSTRPGSRA